MNQSNITPEQIDSEQRGTNGASDAMAAGTPNASTAGPAGPPVPTMADTWNRIHADKVLAAAADAHERAAVRHAYERARVIAEVIRQIFPQAHTVLIDHQENETFDTVMAVMAIRDSEGVLLWYDEDFAEQLGVVVPANIAADDRPTCGELDHDTQKALEVQLEETYDADSDPFDVASEEVGLSDYSSLDHVSFLQLDLVTALRGAPGGATVSSPVASGRPPDADPQPAAPPAAIRRILELSPAHLPPEYAQERLAQAPGVTAHELSYGWLMWVPNDPDDSSEAYEEPVPTEVLAVQRYARQHGCDYVLFDPEADEYPALPTWD